MSEKEKQLDSLPPNAKRVFKGEIFEVWQWEQEMFDGSTETFETIRRPDVANAIVSVGDKILVQIQEQPDQPAPFVSLPGGRCGEGEEPLAAVRRELLEETGYASDDWVLWRTTSPSRARMTWMVYTYIARNARRQQKQQLDAGEKIKLELITFDEFLRLPDDPTFRHWDLVPHLLRARYEPEKKKELRKVLFK